MTTTKYPRRATHEFRISQPALRGVEEEANLFVCVRRGVLQCDSFGVLPPSSQQVPPNRFARLSWQYDVAMEPNEVAADCEIRDRFDVLDFRAHKLSRLTVEAIEHSA